MIKLNIKIAFFDIDGTLTNSNKEITKSTINTLNNLSKLGIKLVLCSGRSNSYLLNIVKKISSIDYIISSNGARIYNVKSNKNIFIDLINSDSINSLWNYCNENTLSCILVSNDISYSNKYTDISNINNKNVIIQNIDELNEISNNYIHQVIVESTDTCKMYDLEQYLNNIKDLQLINYTYDYINKNYAFFDIVTPNVNKGNAIKFLLEYNNINKDNAICFGDSVNDFEMFDSCGIKVAMKNAIEDLKHKATYITESNDNDGISKFFKDYMKKSE